MTNKPKFHIWGQDGEAVAHIREGSVRLGRTLRQASAIRRYVNHQVFVAPRDRDAESPRPDPGAERHYVGAAS